MDPRKLHVQLGRALKLVHAENQQDGVEERSRDCSVRNAVERPKSAMRLGRRHVYEKVDAQVDVARQANCAVTTRDSDEIVARRFLRPRRRWGDDLSEDQMGQRNVDQRNQDLRDRGFG